MSKHIADIKMCGEIAQKLIKDLHTKEPNNETFEQVGMLNGIEVVIDFIENGEKACAIEHLLYMVNESDISYPKEKLQMLNSMALELGIDNIYTDKYA